VAGLAARPGVAEPDRGWLLAGLYPLVAAMVALFIAYPLVEILVRAAFVGERLSFAPIAKVLAEPYNRQAIYNTLSLGLTVAVAGHRARPRCTRTR
jgi:ABC-type Fe3+ transport system permease subunit